MIPITLLGSTFSRRDAITAIAGAFDLTPREAVAFTSRFLDRQSVVRVLAEPETGRDTDLGTERLRTKGGQLVPVTSGDRRYTTTELLAAEQRIVTAATGSIDAGRGWIPREVADQVLGHHPHLDDEQVQGVRKLLTSGNGWDLVVGQAGTGKSTMLRAARLGWEAGGLKVIGAAIAARTAADLEAGTGIPSSSLAQILVDLRESGGLSKHHVVVVEEASLVGTRALDELRSRVEPTGAKVVLVGDNRQLSSIDAGGALRTLASELGPHVVTLTTNRRQGGADQQWERDALVNLREGSPAPAVQAYMDHGRITLTRDIDEARNRLIDDWWAVHHERSTAIMAVRRADVAALNELARARRQAGGELGREYRLGEKTFSVGDRVIFERNQKVHVADEQRGMQAERVRIRNGTFATVVGVTSAGVTGVGVDSRIGSEHERGEQQREALTRAVDGEGDVRGGVHQAASAGADRAAGLVVELDDGKRVILPAQYVAESTSLGYALTVFRSQGITVDHAFGLAGAGLSQEAGYTQLSRGRLSNNLYVTAPENPRWEIGHHADDLSQRDALQSLVDALAQSREQTMARDRLPSWPAVSSSDLDAAYREHASLGQWMAENAPPDVTRELADAYVATVDEAGVGHTDPQAQDHVKELQAAQREREAWVTAHRTDIATWSRLDQDIQRYEYRLGQAASFSPPSHTTASLGSLPNRITEVERWQSAAGAIEAYRLRWGVDAPTAIGPEPQDPEQRAHWQNTFDVVESASSGLPGAWGDPDGTERAELLEMLEQIRSDLEQIGTGLTEYRESLHKAPAIDWGYDDLGYDNDYTIDNDYGYGL